VIILLGLAFTGALGGCCFVRSYPPTSEPVYAPIWTPHLNLHEKAEAYEKAFERYHWWPDGIVDYRRPKAPRPVDIPRYGRHADGPFFTGITLGTFSLKYSVTRAPADLARVSRALRGLELLEGVTGRPGLFARHASRDPPPFDPKLIHPVHGHRGAPPFTDYVWRGDVSKDQYAGVTFGLATCLAYVDDANIRARTAALARRAAERIRVAGEAIVDTGGEQTSFGDLSPWAGPFRIGIHAALVLALAKAASFDGKGDAYYRDLLDRGFGGVVASGVFNMSILTIRNHVNDNMSFLVLFALLKVENDEILRTRYLRGLEQHWSEVGHELNPFFNLAYAACGARKDVPSAVYDARESLKLFPDEKVLLPVDWRRFPELDLGTRFFNSRKCKPRSARPLPMNMRGMGTNMWVSDPDVLVDNEGSRNTDWLAGMDYLQAYWIGRAHGFITANE
jgi:hypothetical protein